jgi:hypothetical protein
VTVFLPSASPPSPGQPIRYRVPDAVASGFVDGSSIPGGDQREPIPRIADFDIAALFQAMDHQRSEQHLSWQQVADQIWQLSSVLNERRPAHHPISPSTITNMAKRDNTSCQHALFFLRWLGRTPESFLPGVVPLVQGGELPQAGADRRLRWNLTSTYAALDARRHEHGLTWPEVARQIGCSPNQLTGIRTARFAINMKLAMRITQWLQRPAADFVYPAEW